MSDSVLVPLVERLTIVTKELGHVALEPNWAQRDVLATAERQLRESGRIRIIILKARQMGLSTITEALLFWLSFIIPGFRSRIVTHETQASHNLLAMTQTYWDLFPFADFYSTKYHSRNELFWKETESFIRVDTAGAKTKKGVGRSATIQGLHASEVALWDNPEFVIQGLFNAIPDSGISCIVLESTAKGRGNFFHQTWQDAEAGLNDFVPLFFPWWKHYEYRASFIGLPFDDLGELSQEEQKLVKLGLDHDQLAWRRYTIKNKLGGDVLKFMEEYPATPEEAFIASGSNVFPYTDLVECFSPRDGVRGELVRDGNSVAFQRTDNGRLTIFKWPSKDKGHANYIVSGDPTHTVEGDPACAQVVNRYTMEQVAEWRGKIDAATFGEELFKLGIYYNTALVSCEVEKVGAIAIGKLLGMNYPRVWRQSDLLKGPSGAMSKAHGWHTTHSSKSHMIAALLKLITDHDVQIHSHTCFSECADYVTDETGTYGPGNPETGHDDTVMALAQAVIIHFLEGPVLPYTLPTPTAPSTNIFEILGMDDPNSPEEYG